MAALAPSTDRRTPVQTVDRLTFRDENERVVKRKSTPARVEEPAPPQLVPAGMAEEDL